jgi:hypothetical protein
MNASTMIGREAVCPECEGKIIITDEHLRRTNITCIGCGRAGFAKNFKHEAPADLPIGAADILKKFKNPHESAAPLETVEPPVVKTTDV